MRWYGKIRGDGWWSHRTKTLKEKSLGSSTTIGVLATQKEMKQLEKCNNNTSGHHKGAGSINTSRNAQPANRTKTSHM
jgi:hypothetical protein